MTLRDHYAAAARQGDRLAQLELDGLPLPAPAAHVWAWFNELHRARASSGFGPAPLGYADLEAWMRVTGAAPRASERDWLLELDQAYHKAFAEKMKKQQK